MQHLLKEEEMPNQVYSKSMSMNSIASVKRTTRFVWSRT